MLAISALSEASTSLRPIVFALVGESAKAQTEGLSGIDQDSNLVEMKKDYDRCGADLD
jgi:hypothetical protein